MLLIFNQEFLYLVGFWISISLRKNSTAFRCVGWTRLGRKVCWFSYTSLAEIAHFFLASWFFSEAVFFHKSQRHPNEVMLMIKRRQMMSDFLEIINGSSKQSESTLIQEMILSICVYIVHFYESGIVDVSSDPVRQYTYGFKLN